MSTEGLGRPLSASQMDHLRVLEEKLDRCEKAASREYVKDLGDPEKEKIPQWASDFFHAHTELLRAVNDYEQEGYDVSERLREKIDISLETITKIANKIRPFIPGTAKLLKSKDPKSIAADPMIRDWQLNFALLASAHEKAETPEAKEKIRFLMANYLAKAAYFGVVPPGIAVPESAYLEDYKSLLQVGLFLLGGMYHRSVCSSGHSPDFLGLKSKLSIPQKFHEFIPIETTEIQDLYKTNFVPISYEADEEESVGFITEEMTRYLDSFKDPELSFPDYSTKEKTPKAVLELPFIIDISSEIEDSIITDGEEAKIDKHNILARRAKDKINALIKKAAAELHKRYSHIPIQALENYIKGNTTVVSRVPINPNFGALIIYDIFDATDFHAEAGKKNLISEKKQFFHRKLTDWVSHTAILPGAITTRKAFASLQTDPDEIARELQNYGPPVEYAVKGAADHATTPIIFSQPEDFLLTNTFKDLRLLAQGAFHPPADVSEGQMILADSTVKMLEFLLSNPELKRQWEAITDPGVKELLQVSLLRLQQELAVAVLFRKDFRKYTQALDRAHCHIATLLEFFKISKPGEFEKNYQQYLAELFEPSGLFPQTIGIAKSAMNVFSGINAILAQKNPHFQRVYGEHTYYEEVGLAGESHSLKSALEDERIDKIDLYVGEFYHNIDIDPTHTRYEKGSIIKDIKEIFEKKPATDALTVAIDATIDFALSMDIQNLLTEFAEQIKAGKLNIVVFRSGQKFDMLGLDNYYGAPFYIINNKDPKWSSFEKLKTDPAFHTDSLSLEYFSLVASCIPDNIDRYKKIIFDNTKAILEQVPQDLKPAKGNPVCVCSFDPDVKTPFIDIKIGFEEDGTLDELRNEELSYWMQERFTQIFMDEKKLVYRRGSFGFPHPNITWISPKMRINPGIDPDEIRLYRQFFLELDAKVKEMKSAQG